MAIRYDASLNEQLRRTVRNYNAKIKRLEKRGYTREQLPEPTSVQQLKAEYANRAGLKRELKSLSKFNVKGAETLITTAGGIEMTNYRLEELKGQLRAAKGSLTKRLKEAKEHEPVDAIFQSNWYKQLQAKSESLKGLRIEQLNSKALEDHLKDIISEVNYTKKSELFYENFFDMIGVVARDENDPDIEYIQNRLRELTPRQLSMAYEQFSELKSIGEKYKSNKQKWAKGVKSKEEQMYVDMADEGETIEFAGQETTVADLREKIDVIVDTVKNQ